MLGNKICQAQYGFWQALLPFPEPHLHDLLSLHSRTAYATLSTFILRYHCHLFCWGCSSAAVFMKLKCQWILWQNRGKCFLPSFIPPYVSSSPLPSPFFNAIPCNRHPSCATCSLIMTVSSEHRSLSFYSQPSSSLDSRYETKGMTETLLWLESLQQWIWW